MHNKQILLYYLCNYHVCYLRPLLHYCMATEDKAVGCQVWQDQRESPVSGYTHVIRQKLLSCKNQEEK